MNAKQVRVIQDAVKSTHARIEVITTEIRKGDYEARLKLHCHGADFFSAPIDADFEDPDVASKLGTRIDQAIGGLYEESHASEVVS